MRTSPQTIEDENPPAEIRIHFIEEWALKENLSRAEIGRRLDVDKSLVSRWFGGAIPSEKWLSPLADLLGTSVHGLFRHPEEDAILKAFEGRPAHQRSAALAMIKIFFQNQPAEDSAKPKQPGRARS